MIDWCGEDCRQKLLACLSLEQQNNRSHWLTRLKETAGYQTQQEATKEKAPFILHCLAKELEEMDREIAHQILAEATETCGDRAALSVNTLSIH